jgi:hypothetical protein
MLRSAAVAGLLLVAGTAAYSQTKDHAPAALPYAQRMTHDRGESWNYKRPSLDLRRYRNVIIDRTVVYRGPDAQFDGIDQGERGKFAEITTRALTEEIGKSLPIVTRPGPDTLRLKMTLLGVDKTTGGVATATRVTPMGFAMSAVKSLAGKQGTFTGSVLYAVELTDSRSGELQIAAVRRMSPDALDIPATISTSETVKAVAESSAKRIRERLEAAMGR